MDYLRLAGAGFEKSPVPFAVIDFTVGRSGQFVDFVFLHFNHAFVSHFGHTSEKTKGIRAKDVFSEIDVAEMLVKLSPLTETDEHVCFEQHFSAGNKDYQITVWKLEKSIFAATFLDISNAKKHERDLINTREQFYLAVTGSKEGIWDWNLRENTLYLSPTWKNMIGYEDHEIENVFSSYEERLHPDEKPRVMEYVQKYLNGEIQEYKNEFRFRHRDGHYIWVLAKGEALRDENGRPYRMAGIHADVSDRKLAEEKLDEERRWLDKILGLTGAGINVIDAEFNLVSVDSSWTTAYGPFQGTKCYRYFQGLNEPCSDCMVAKALSANAAQVAERLLPRENNRLVEVHTIPFSYNDGRRLLANFVIDITERKKHEEELLNINRHLREATYFANELADKAEMANVAKTHFLANMSHEIRTPMNGIIGMTGLLLETELDDEQRLFTELVSKSANDLMVLVDDILDLSKIESEKVEIESLDFDLREVVEDACDILAIRAHEKNLEFCLEISHDVCTRLRGDPGRLRQIILNLGGNAVKFTESGHVIIKVSQELALSKNLFLRFDVIDTGIGIAEDKWSLLFTPFQQIDPSMTRKFGGTGLGLALAKKLAELLGGEMGFTSKEKKGSDFWFTVMVEKQPQHQHENKRNFQGLKVLVVEDNRECARMLCNMLKEADVQFELCENGLDANERIVMACLAKVPFQLVLVDRFMPKIDGLKLGKKLSTEQLVSRPNLVMMAPIGNHFNENELEENGFVAAVNKPVRKSVLLDCLERYGVNLLPNNAPVRANSRAEFLTDSEKKAQRILLVEDDFTNQRVILGLLTQFGFNADLAEDGEIAVAMVREKIYDLILMDIQIPRIDGFMVTTKIRSNKDFSTSRDVIIVAVTAYALSGDRQRCLEAGMNDYLSKPIKSDSIWNILKKWLTTKKTSHD